MKFLAVFGTRPEAIKLSPVLTTLRAERGVTTHICITGQHRDLTRPILDLFSLHADLDLEAMVPQQALNPLIARLVALSRHANLINVVREQFNGASFSLPIGAASGPSMQYPVSLAHVCDLVLLDERGLKPDMVARRFAQMSDYDRPLGMVVDAGNDLSHFAASFHKSASWTYSPLRLTQYFPFVYTPDTAVAGGADLGALLRQVASLMLKKPPEEGDSGTE